MYHCVDSESHVTFNTTTQLLSPDITSTCAFRSCSSAPQSRVGSFKRSRKLELSEDVRSSLPSLEDSIISKLEELKQLEEDDCLAVRQFETSSRGIVNRGDSFRRHRGAAPHNSHGTECTTSEPHRQTSADKMRQVLILGDRSVGKTALLQQFMTSQYMAAMNTSFDVDCDKTLSVMLNEEETLLNFVDMETSLQPNHSTLYPDAHCYILLYSITDKKSFNYIVDLLTDIERLRHTDNEVIRPVIVVGNKNDLVRKHQVKDRDAIELCTKHGFKFISVSAVLNHRLDELLVGIVSQLRLYYSHVTSQQPITADNCMTSSRGLFKRLLFPRRKETCEDFLTM